MSYSAVGYLYPKKPFDFSKSLRFLDSFTPGKNEQQVKENLLVKGVQVGNQNFVFSIFSIGSVEKPKLKYELCSNKYFGKKVQKNVEEKIGFYLSTDDDLTEFYNIGEEDKYFEPIIENLYGYHQVKFFSAFENACWAVMSMRTPMNLAKKMKKDFSEKYGAYLQYNNEFYLSFPDAKNIKEISEEEVIEVVGNRKKGEYLKNVIDFFAQDDNQYLEKENYDEVKKKLLDIKGIGEWSASFILLRSLGFMEDNPTKEKVLKNKVNDLYKNCDIKSEEIANSYGNYVGYWAHYIRAYESVRGK